MAGALKLRYKVGAIEFEAEGDPEKVEQQRQIFMEAVLPAAVEAMVRTAGSVVKGEYVDAPDGAPALQSTPPLTLVAPEPVSADMSINEFLNSKKFSSQIDTTLGLIYFNEKYKGAEDFSTDEAKQYFRDAKIKVPGNPSDVISKLVGKSFIMDSGSKGRYKLTRTGESYVDAFVAKQNGDGKAKSKSRTVRTQKTSTYSALTADDLNLKKYPEIKSQDSFKKQMMLALYIVSKEGHGDSFSVVDVQCIMTSKLGLPAAENQIQGVFRREKTWFTTVADETNKRAFKYKLLVGAKDFAEAIVAENASKLQNEN